MDRVNHTYQPFGSLICRGFYYNSRRTFSQSPSAILEDSCCLDMHICRIVSVKPIASRKWRLIRLTYSRLDKEVKSPPIQTSETPPLNPCANHSMTPGHASTDPLHRQLFEQRRAAISVPQLDLSAFLQRAAAVEADMHLLYREMIRSLASK